MTSPIFSTGPWGFWDETWTQALFGFTSREDAERGCRAYALSLTGCPKDHPELEWLKTVPVFWTSTPGGFEESSEVSFVVEMDDGGLDAMTFRVDRGQFPDQPPLSWSLWEGGDLHDGFRDLAELLETFPEVWVDRDAYRAGAAPRPISEAIETACRASGVSVEDLIAAEAAWAIPE